VEVEVVPLSASWDLVQENLKGRVGDGPQLTHPVCGRKAPSLTHPVCGRKAPRLTHPCAACRAEEDSNATSLHICIV
jgi:hypothetical protein